MMNQQDAFLQAICENPDDDSPRLIFADWLEDHGQSERAEFIRGQIERTRLPARDPRQRDLAKRETILLRQFARTWFPLPRGWNRRDHLVIRRGFPEGLTHGGDVLVAQAHLLGHWPITRLHFTDLTQDLAAKAANWSFLARIRDLNLYYLHSDRTETGISTVLESAWLANLVRLNVGSTHLGDEGVRHLAGLPHLAGLRELDLRHNFLTGAGMQDLIGSPYRKGMTTLSLCGNPGIVASVLALLSSPNWPALSDLCLWYTSLDDDGLEQLAACPGLAKLTALNLSNNDVTDRGLEALARSVHARNLRTLLLPLNRFSPRIVSLLIDSSHLQGLTSLNLYETTIDGQTKRKLRKHFDGRISFAKPW
jgi:uncharacterized protein (TIGR02996 family)